MVRPELAPADLERAAPPLITARQHEVLRLAWREGYYEYPKRISLRELATRLGLVNALDDAIGPIKQRDRGLSGGELLMALAQTQMLGGDFLVSLDRRRADATGEA